MLNFTLDFFLVLFVKVDLLALVSLNVIGSR